MRVFPKKKSIIYAIDEINIFILTEVFKNMEKFY